MKSVRRGLVHFGLLVLFAGVVSGQEIAWVKTWAEAKKIAAEQKKPIMVHFNMDGEPACEECARTHFHNKEVVELSKKFVCLIGSRGAHESEKIAQIPADSPLCHRFGTVTCAEHVKAETDVRLEILQSNIVTAPQFLFLTPDRKILARRVYAFSPGELLKMMNRALEYYQPGMGDAAAAAAEKEQIATFLKDAVSGNEQRRKSAIAALASRDEPEIIQFFLAQTGGDIDETRRKDAIKAIADACNANCLPRLCQLLKDRSAGIRRASAKALYQMGMAEAVPGIVDAFGTEASITGKALYLRVLAACALYDPKVEELLEKSLTHPKPLLREQAAWALALGVPKESALKKVMTMAKGDTDNAARAVGAVAATKMVRRMKKPVSQRDRARTSKDMADAAERDLRPILRTIRDKDSDATIKYLASQCMEALERDNVDFEEGLKSFFRPDAIFSDES